MTIGVCCFENTNDPESGWASVEGQEAEWVNGIGDLNDQVLWVTNLPFLTHRKLNLASKGNIFDTQYFRTAIDNIGSEMGIQSDLKTLSEFCSREFKIVADMGEKYLDISLMNPGYRYHKTASYQLLPDYVRQQPSGINSADIIEAMNHSTQANQAMSGLKRPAGAQPVGLLFPRHVYGKWLLSLPMPGENKWKVVKQRENSTKFGVEGGKVLRNTASVLERLNEIGEKNALFLRVSVHSMDKFYQNFASFSAGEKYIRRWATLPEVLELARIAKISINGGYMCKLSESPIISDSIFGQSDMSFARGLLIENVISALASPVSNQNGSRQTMLSAYLRAYDRIACGRAAAKLASEGFVVGSYSMGRIVVFMRPGEGRRLAQKALEIGLMPPMGFLNSGED